MDKRIKILFVSHDPRLYGAQKSLLDLILGLNKDLFKPIVLESREGPLTEILRKNDIETLSFPFEFWVGANLKKTFFRAVKLIQVSKNIEVQVRPLQPDLIYTNTAVIPIGGISAKKLKIPHIWHIREFVQQDLGVNYDFGTILSMKFMSLSSERIICNSQAIKQKLSQYIPGKKLTLVYNGFLDSSNTPSPPNKDFSRTRPFSLCMVGSVTPHKGHGDALLAVNFLKEKGINTRLRIVGDGPAAEMAKLKELSRKLNISANVHFEGFREDINSVFFSSDATLVCSRQEAFGRVAVESMAAGTPVIGTNTGGLPEVVEDRITGFLYPPGDIPSLAEKIQTLLNNPSLYNSFSAAGYLSVYKKFTKQRYVTELEKIIRETVHNN